MRATTIIRNPLPLLALLLLPPLLGPVDELTDKVDHSIYVDAGVGSVDVEIDDGDVDACVESLEEYMVTCYSSSGCISVVVDEMSQVICPEID